MPSTGHTTPEGERAEMVSNQRPLHWLDYLWMNPLQCLASEQKGKAEMTFQS